MKHTISVRKLLFLAAMLFAESLVGLFAGAAPPGAVAMPASRPATTQSSDVKPVTVGIDSFTFEPQELTVAVGTTVTWINHDDVPHTATSKDKIFRSPALDTDERYSFTFARRGTYPYFCAVHPHMTGKIIVK